LRYATLQGKAIWILGFFSFLSGLNAINAIILLDQLGLEGTFQPYLIDSLTGPIPVYIYLLVSILATFVFLGATSNGIVSELSNKSLLNEINAKVDTLESGQKNQKEFLESLQARVFLVDESIGAFRKEVAKGLGEQGEMIKQVHTNLVNRFDTKLADAKNGIVRQLSEQGEEIKEIQVDLVNRFDTKLADVKDGIARQLGKIENTMSRHERRNRKNVKAILKQMDEIADIRLKVDKLEDELAKMPKPQLTSQSNSEEVRGIGKNTGNELREMGITNVGELILTDSAVIAEKTGTSEKTVEKLQGRAQLAMVPSVKEKDLILLEEVGITNRKELADQDPLELGRKINGILEDYVEKGKISEAEKPTIEEIYSWIKSAKA
jgi:hypothetical protein